MKKLLSAIALLSIAVSSFAQKVAVQGSVTDAQGKPVPFAFVRDSQHSYATFTDQAGHYSLKADAASKLIATAKGYGEASAAVKSGTVNMTLPTGNGSGLAAGPANTKQFSVQSDRETTTIGGVIKGTSSEVKGKRFLSEGWMHGFGISPADSVVQNTDYLFNYDMMDGQLFYTLDQNNMFKVDGQKLKQFTLYDDNGQPYQFESVPAIDNAHYVQVVASGDKYKIYKQIYVKYVKANYQTNGMTSTGNNYDEYVPESTYYLVTGNGAPVKFNPKKKVLKELFAGDADKLNKYMSSASGDIDDTYLRGLADSVNP